MTLEESERIYMAVKEGATLVMPKPQTESLALVVAQPLNSC